MWCSRKILSLLTAVLAAGLFSGCQFIFGEDAGGGDSGGGGGGDNDGIRRITSISADTRLENVENDPNKVDYIMDSYVDIDAVLTIDPGVVIEVESGRSMSVGTDGAIVAKGTDVSPIRFIGKTPAPGSWGGVYIRSNNPSNELSNVEISHAGDSDEPAVTLYSDAQVSITHCTFRNNSGYGIYVNGKLNAFEENIFENNAKGSVNISPMQVGNLDSTSSYGSKVVIFSGYVTSSQTWKPINNVYEVDTYIEVEKGTLTIDPGARFQFKNSGYITVKSEAELVAVGTADERIEFSGTTAAAGHWCGLHIRSGSLVNEISYVDISYAGDSEDAGVNLHSDSRLKITNSSFKNNYVAGVYLSSSAELNEFSNNDFKENGYPMNIYANHIESLDEGSDYSGNTEDHVLVYSNEVIVTGTETVWPAINVPYKVDSYIDIEKGKVNINPGSHFKFTSGGYLNVSAEGVLVAAGTEDSRIVFEGTVAAPGHWDGIIVKSGSTENELSYCEIAYGNDHNIYLDSDSRLDVNNCIIRDSNGYGIQYSTSSSLTETANEYSGLPSGNISE